MTQKHYTDPLNLTIKANIPSDDILMSFATDTMIPDFDVIVKAGNVEYVARSRSGKCDKCSADFSYDRVLTIFVRGYQHGLGLGEMSVRLVVYGYYGECSSCPEPTYDLYSALPYELVDNPELSGVGAKMSAELAASFVSITREFFSIGCVKNPQNYNELATVIKGWSTQLADPAKYRIFLLRKRRRSKRGSYWAIPEFATADGSRLKMTSWPISAYSHKQPIFMGADSHWLNDNTNWLTVAQDGGYNLGQVLNLNITPKGLFHNGRKKLEIGFAIFRNDEALGKWVQASNIATAHIFPTSKGIIISTNR